jgi:hypothetical protein
MELRMGRQILPQMANTNPAIFEDLANALASLTTFIQAGNINAPVEEFEHIYRSALREPLCYTDLNALTGQSTNASDRRAGRAGVDGQAAAGIRHPARMEGGAVHPEPEAGLRIRDSA